MTFTSESVDFEKSHMWWASSNQLKTLTEPRLISEEKELCWQTTFGLELQLFPRSPACWPILQISDLISLHNHTSQFLTINLILSSTQASGSASISLGNSNTNSHSSVLNYR